MGREINKERDRDRKKERDRERNRDRERKKRKKRRMRPRKREKKRPRKRDQERERKRDRENDGEDYRERSREETKKEVHVAKETRIQRKKHPKKHTPLLLCNRFLLYFLVIVSDFSRSLRLYLSFSQPLPISVCFIWHMVLSVCVGVSLWLSISHSTWSSRPPSIRQQAGAGCLHIPYIGICVYCYDN